MSKLLILLIKIYQFSISPFLGNNCRFYPSCSEYTIQAIRKVGVKGLFWGFRRVCKCHPFNQGGYDPIKE